MITTHPTLFKTTLFSVGFFVVFSAFCHATSLDDKLKPYLKNGSVLVADDQQILFDLNSDKLFVPASIFKLATALSALHHLESDFRFTTEFFLSAQNDLIVRGQGDPQLVSEELAAITDHLVNILEIPKTLNRLYLDDSSFADNIVIPGVENTANPYDARNGALVANFNTIYIKVDADNKIQSAEKQTPLTPLAIQLAQGLEPGKKHRINISRQRQYILPYVGGLLQAFLQQSGVAIKKGVAPRTVSGEDYRIYAHKNSNQLIQNIEAMMLYSNNFIANQLFLATGMLVQGSPATLEKGALVLKDYLLNELAIAEDQVQLVEGSGISRQNKITAQAMLTILKEFYPHRRRLAKHLGVRVKTGTLKGVYSIVGYLSNDSNRPLYFVIMLNQKKNYRDKILKILLEEDF